VLTGEGSDEIFAGYPHHRRDLAMTSTAGERPGVDRLVAAVRVALGGFAPTWVQAFAMAGQRLIGLLRPELAARLVRRDVLASFVGGLEASRQLRGRHPVHQAMYLWSKSVLPNYILSAAGDRMEMAHAVASRLPFLDHRVVELSTRLPIDRLIRGGVEKYLLREVARPVVTEAVYRRPKDRFVAPELEAAETGSLRELVRDTLSGSALRATPFFDPARVTALLESLPARDAATRAAGNSSLMTIASVCIMQARFGITGAA
jgi:asparagine synthase (glutamine-hydrolysing)